MKNALQFAMETVERAMADEAGKIRPTLDVKPMIETLNSIPPEMPKQMTPGQIINERGHTHGDYNETAKIAQAFKMVIRDRGDRLSPVQRESLEMVATKIARILAGDPNAAEHWNDIAGYALLAAQRI